MAVNMLEFKVYAYIDPLESIMITEEEILSDLTPSQQEAVTHVEGPLLVLAGAGSGKTRVVTRRIGYLTTQDIDPSSIVAITFTS